MKHLKAMESAASAVLMKGAKAGGEIALEDARQHCPVDTGALKASLAITENKATPLKADVKVDFDRKIKYGTHVELGSRGKTANPFLRNAVDNNLEQINLVVAETIAKAVGRKM